MVNSYPSIALPPGLVENDDEDDITPTGRSQHTWGGNPESDDEEFLHPPESKTSTKGCLYGKRARVFL